MGARAIQAKSGSKQEITQQRAGNGAADKQ